MRLSIKSMLFSIMIIMVVAATVQGLYGLSALNNSNEHMKSFSEVSLPRTTTLANIQDGFAKFRLSESSSLAETTGSASQESGEAALLQINTELGSLWGDPAIQSEVKHFADLWRNYVKQHFVMLELIDVGNRSVAADMYTGELGTIFVDASDVLTDLMRREKNIAIETAAQAEKQFAIGQFIVWAALGGILLFGLVALLFVWRGISSPLLKITNAMKDIADGDLKTPVPDMKNPYEVQQISQTLIILRNGLREAETVRSEAAERDAKQTKVMEEERNRIANSFQESVGALVQQFVSSSKDLRDAAENLFGTAEKTTHQAADVSTEAFNAAESVQSVASSTEEMSASVSEIGEQVTRSAKVASIAADKTIESESNIRTLSTAASEISDVVKLISDIAAQTNLLALNATIEAARAGEAGKGFAVVASEVKSLAAQTAQATEEIIKKVTEIQSATDTTVSSIGEIVDVIKSIRETTSSIAGAVEEQGAATEEIASATQRAASAAQNVSNVIVGVSNSAETTRSSVDDLKRLSTGLEESSINLQRDVDTFLMNLRHG